MGFSIALMGATMAVSGTMDLLETILLTAVNDQELAKTINEAFGGIELPLTYGLAGLGYFFQLMVRCATVRASLAMSSACDAFMAHGISPPTRLVRPCASVHASRVA